MGICPGFLQAYDKNKKILIGGGGAGTYITPAPLGAGSFSKKNKPTAICPKKPLEVLTYRVKK